MVGVIPSMVGAIGGVLGVIEFGSETIFVQRPLGKTGMRLPKPTTTDLPRVTSTPSVAQGVWVNAGVVAVPWAGPPPPGCC